MHAKGFFASLFDYSFSTFITSRVIRVLYILTTIILALWTLVIVLAAFRSSTGLGIAALLVGGPLFFVFTMIYARVVLELIMVIFRIHEDVDDINRRGAGAVTPEPEPGYDPSPVATPEPPAAAAPATLSSPAPEAAVEPQAVTRFCENCGVERKLDKRFCVACGTAFA
jgi:hypothetical protein